VRIPVSRISRIEFSWRRRFGFWRLLALVVPSACMTTLPRPKPIESAIQPFSQDSVTRDSTGRRVAALTGLVLDSASGTPLEGSQVLLGLSTLRKPYYTFTDRGGSFILGRVEPGSYQLLIRRVGYGPHVERRTLRTGAVDTIRVKLGIFNRPPCAGIDCY
jgi:hypothetical protein